MNCESVKLVLRRELDPSVMVGLNPLAPNVIPDEVVQILQDSESRDECASRVSRFFEVHGWTYKPTFTPVYVYGDNQNPVASGAQQGVFGEAFLLKNAEVLRDLVLVCDEDVQTAACNQRAQKFRTFSSNESELERMQILCSAVDKAEWNRPPEARLYRRIKRQDLDCWLPR